MLLFAIVSKTSSQPVLAHEECGDLLAVAGAISDFFEVLIQGENVGIFSCLYLCRNNFVSKASCSVYMPSNVSQPHGKLVKAIYLQKHAGLHKCIQHVHCSMLYMHLYRLDAVSIVLRLYAQNHAA